MITKDAVAMIVVPAFSARYSGDGVAVGVDIIRLGGGYQSHMGRCNRTFGLVWQRSRVVQIRVGVWRIQSIIVPQVHPCFHCSMTNPQNSQKSSEKMMHKVGVDKYIGRHGGCTLKRGKILHRDDNRKETSRY